MKKSNLAVMAVLLMTMLSSCEVIGAIFKAGIWVGVIIVVIVLAAIFYFVGGKKKD